MNQPLSMVKMDALNYRRRETILRWFNTHKGGEQMGGISIILSKTSPDILSVNGILATEKYVTGYACKGNQSTGELVDLFNVLAHSCDEQFRVKLPIDTIKRDISSTESSYELLELPLFHRSHQFLTISLKKLVKH